VANVAEFRTMAAVDALEGGIGVDGHCGMRARRARMDQPVHRDTRMMGNRRVCGYNHLADEQGAKHFVDE